MTHPRGRQPIGVNQPPAGGQDYPFLAPSSDIHRLLAGFYLVYPASPGAILPLRIGWLYGFGTDVVAPPAGWPAGDARDLVVLDAGDNRVFDSTEATSYRETSWDGRLLLMEWRSASAVCHAIMHTQWSPQDVPQTYDTYIEPAQGELDARTYRQLPSALQLYAQGVVLSPAAVLAAGYNTTLEVENGKIAVNVQAGAGGGRYPDCGDGLALRSINHVGPDAAGNFYIDASGCYRSQLLTRRNELHPHTASYADPGLSTQEAKAGMRLFNDCAPCCGCEDFASTYKGLRRLWQRWRNVAAQLEYVREVYERDNQRLAAAQSCQEDNAARLFLTYESGCTSLIGATYCNLTACCLSAVELRFTLQLYTSGVLDLSQDPATVEAPARLKTKRGDLPYAVAGEWPVFRAFLPALGPGETGAVTFRLLQPHCNRLMAFRVTVTAHAPAPVVNAAGAACTLPDRASAVPADILALWAGAGVAAAPTVRAVISQAMPLRKDLPWE